MGRHVAIIAVWLAFVPQVIAAQTDCRAEDPSGYFEGSATTPEEGKLDLALNLRCADGRYSGALLTSIGTFELTGGSFTEARVRLQFNARGETGLITAQLVSGVLSGTFKLATDSGPVELRRLGDARPPTPSEPVLTLTAGEWREDVRFFATELPKRHMNAFHTTPKERFEAAVAAVESEISGRDGDQMYVGLARISNLVGDGHTYIRMPPDRAPLPIEVQRFGSDYRVTAVTTGAERALGARLLAIQDTPISRVRELLLPLTPVDETMILRDDRIELYLTVGMLLHGVGVTPDRSQARLTLAGDDNKRFTLDLKALDPEETSSVKWTRVYQEAPLFRQRPEDPLWFTYLPESRAVYCSFRGYQTLAKDASGLFQLIGERQPEKLIIDMRLNGGGDYTKGLKYLVDPIRALPNINRKGHLFILIGPATFSAAMSNSAHFRYQTEAMLVGETIGEKPNSYQEVRQVSLPNSHLVLRYSIKFYTFVEQGPNLIRPDKEIVPTWDEYRSGRDPVLEWIARFTAR